MRISAHNCRRLTSGVGIDRQSERTQKVAAKPVTLPGWWSADLAILRRSTARLTASE
jgi:hypothetical protein